MAQISVAKKASVLVVVALAAAATASAQEFASTPAPAPAPSLITGAAFYVPSSGVMIGASLVLSFLALFKN